MSVLYMGDTSLSTAASYLAGVLTSHQIEFDYVSSSQRCDDRFLETTHDAVILSDYPAANFTSAQLARLQAKVQNGLGLVMIGGWESFTGLGGDYHKTVLSEILPVRMLDSDDRVNWSGPCVVEKIAEHPIVASLPLAENLPVIGGFNEVKAKADALTVLAARRFSVSMTGTDLSFTPLAVSPLLVVGACGKGRVTAFMSDAAPHWVGGLVDWGSPRTNTQAPGAEPVEVGQYYAKLFATIIRWTANLL